MPRALAGVVVTLLGVLASGGAYLPLDPAAPRTRLKHELAEASAPVVVTQRGLADHLPRTPAQVMLIDRAAEPGSATAPLVSRCVAESPAYVIYTSGSTGQPKGVEVVHGGLSRLVAWHRRTYSVTPADRAPVVASPSFDASSFELWPYLCSGAKVVIPPADVTAAPDRLIDLLSRERVTLSHMPTPLAEAVLAELAEPRWARDRSALSALRVLLLGGDRLRRAPQPLPPFPLVNHYGPTESTVVCSAGTVRATAGPPPIGRPIVEHRLRLLDPTLRPMPLGAAGHLHVAGPGLARGYLRRPAWTAERFVPDPFSEGSGGRLYRTGDLARQLGDGRIQFLGRIDHQVKLRGFRVELGEVEVVLARHPVVRTCAVVVRKDRLVAFFTVDEDGPAGRRITAHRRAPFSCPRGCPSTWCRRGGGARRAAPLAERQERPPRVGLDGTSRGQHGGRRHGAGRHRAAQPDAGGLGGDLRHLARSCFDRSRGGLLRARRTFSAGSAGHGTDP